MIFSLLQDLGFSRNEANVYLYLMNSKFASPTKVSKELNLSRSTVYSVLSNLKKKNLTYLDPVRQNWIPISFDNYYVDCNQNLLLAKKFLSKYANPELALSPVLMQGKNKCRLAFNLQLRRNINRQSYIISAPDTCLGLFFKGIDLSNCTLITNNLNSEFRVLGFKSIELVDIPLYSGLKLVVFEDSVWLLSNNFEYCFSVNDKSLVAYLLSNLLVSFV
jgi:hypothetical protein